LQRSCLIAVCGDFPNEVCSGFIAYMARTNGNHDELCQKICTLEIAL